MLFMFSILLDFLIAVLISLMVYSLSRWLGLDENVSGFLSGMVCSWIIGTLAVRSKSFRDSDMEDDFDE
jgi:hypothetical protein